MTASAAFGGARSAAALNTLSALGAGVAGVGLGILLASSLERVAWPILIGGLVVHLFGMVGRHRAQIQGGQATTRWEMAAYWLCWIAIGAVAVILVLAALS